MLAVIGGSGFYEFITDGITREMSTPYGKPSASLIQGKINGKDVVFLPRHGRDHEYPPHKIPYKANIFALKDLGVTRIIAPAAVGSLKQQIKPGEFLVPDQFVNFTRREDTFFDTSPVTHISTADPYCDHLRSIINDSMKAHTKGTVVVVHGPRFSTKAESSIYSKMGDVINMTQYPEVALAREKEMCYASICVITDYDAGLGIEKSVTLKDALKKFKENNEKLKEFIVAIASKLPEERKCGCSKALEGARF